MVTDVRPALLNMTPNTPVATAVAPIPVTGFRSASIQGTTVLVRGRSEHRPMATVRGELRRTHSRLTIFDARTRGEYLERVEQVVWITVGQIAGLRARARYHLPDRRHVLCGRSPTARDRNSAGARCRAPPCPVAHLSGRRLLGRHGRGPRPRGDVRARSLARFPRWIPISLRSWVLCQGIRFCSWARRCCSWRRRSPVPCPLGGRYGLTRRRRCGRCDRTPAVTVLAHDQRIPHRAPRRGDGLPLMMHATALDCGSPLTRGYAASLHSLASAAWSRRLWSPPPRRMSVQFLSIRPAFTLPPTSGRRCSGTPEPSNTYSRFEGRAGRGCAGRTRSPGSSTRRRHGR